MLLTARTLGELVRSLRSHPKGTAEKRVEMRVGIRTKVGMLLLDPATGAGRERLSAWVRDVSAGGVGLLSGRRLKQGETFDLIMESAGGGEERVPCIITYCQAVGTDLFRVGARFLFPSAFSAEHER
jgi:hypothetical protein